MKIEKKHWIIIAIVVILIALWYFFLRKKSTSTTSGYAGMYGSFGNESGYDSRLDAALPMIGRESGYAGNESGYKKDPCASHTCPSGCTKISISNGRCGCKCYRQGQMGPVWA